MPAQTLARAAAAALAVAVMFAVPSAAPAQAAGGPAASPGGPYVTVEGALTLFSSTVIDPAGGDPHVYEWDFDYDGATFAADQSAASLTAPGHTYPDDAVTLVAVRLTDALGAVGPITTSNVTVQNAPPTAFAGGPYEVDTGVGLAIHGAAFDAGEDSLTYEWDFDFSGGAFVIDATGSGLADPTHTYTSAGSRVIALRVRDDDGGLSAIVLASVQVAAIGPVADAGGPYTTTNGLTITTERAITFSGAATQAGTGDLTFDWEFEHNGCNFVPDLSGVGLTDPVHLYQTRGNYLVALRVIDADGTEGALTFASVTVLSDLGVAAPAASAGGPYTVTEGGAVAIGGTVTGSPLGAGFEFAWDLNNQCSFDVSGQGTTFSAVSLDGPSEREITFQVTDPVDGAVAIASATVTILNAPPVVTLDLPETVTSGVNRSLFASAQDPGTLDTLSFQWDFESDGRFDAFGNPAFFKKTVDATTDFVITVRVTDDDGAFDEESGVITVRSTSPGIVAAPATPTVIADSTPGTSFTPIPATTATPAPLPTAVSTRAPEPTATATAMPGPVPASPTATAAPATTATPTPTPPPLPTVRPPIEGATEVVAPDDATPVATIAAAPQPADTVTPQLTATLAPLETIPEAPAPPPVEIKAVLIEARSDRDVFAASESGELTVRIPAGALPEATELFVVSTSPQITLARGPDGERVAGASIDVGTGLPGVEFDSAIEITVRANQALLEAAAGNPAAITFRQLDAATGLWRVVPSRVEGDLLIVEIKGAGRLVPTVPGPPPRPGEAIAILAPGEERILATAVGDEPAGVIVVVPAGAVDSLVSLVYVPRRASGIPQPNEGQSLLGAPFELTVFRLDEEQKGLEFAQPLRVFVPLTQEQLGLLESGLNLTLVFFDEASELWVTLPTTPVEGGLRADISHLSLFAVSVDAELDIEPDIATGGPASLYLVSPFDGGAPPRVGGPITATLMLDPGGATITDLDVSLLGTAGVLAIDGFTGVGLCEGAGSADGQGGAALDCTLPGYSGRPLAVGELILAASGVGAGTISITDNSAAGTDLIGLVQGLSLNVQPALTVESVSALIGDGDASIWWWLAPAIAVPAGLIALVLVYALRRRSSPARGPSRPLKPSRRQRRPEPDPAAGPPPREPKRGVPKAVTVGGLIMLGVIVAVAIEHLRRKRRSPERKGRRGRRGDRA